MKKLIDSINFIINEIYNLDFKHLKKLGINPKYFQVKNRGFTVSGYNFKYNNIDFSFRPLLGTIIVKTTTHRVLEKDDVTLSDLEIYKEILSKTILKIFNTMDLKINLERLDYCVDIELADKLKKLYIELYRLHDPKFRSNENQKIV